MTEKPIIADRFKPTIRQEAELDAFRRMLDASAGTCSFSLSVCNSPALRDFLIQKIITEKSNIHTVRLDKSVIDVFDFVTQDISPECPEAVFVVNIESSLPSNRKDYPVLQNLNFSRERWKARFSCPVVFWLPEYAAALLSVHARDLYSWISHQFEFVSEQASAQMGTQDRFAGDVFAASSLTLEQKQFRIAELEQRITDAGDPPQPELTDYALIWLNELAFLYQFIGNLDRAENMHQKSLEIHLKLGRLEEQAVNYGNLGIIHFTRGDLDRAEDMHKRSLEINLKLGSLEGQAAEYGNLGNIYFTRGDLERAEDMHQKSLEIFLKLGRLEGQAIQYGNLGVIYRTRGELDRAENMQKKSLEIYLRLGSLEGQANQYANLGLIYRTRGDLDRAEDMLQKSLEIYLKLGSLEGQAANYGNLGLIYRTRDDLKQARSYWRQARQIYQQIGMPHMVQQINDWLNDLPPESPD